ncbi:MAG: Uncharacterised protein [Crocinitomicaceae bacterium]|nr:MAG: Uncharacterised protein [Crocinitomicaceae bacterium]
MKKLNIYCFLFSQLIILSAFSQLPGSGISLGSNVLDGVYIQEHIPTKRVVSYIHLREADVMWSKRVWRTIDLKEKKNHKLKYPIVPQNDRICLYDVIKYGAIEEGSITIYDPNLPDNNDKFEFPVRPTNGNSNSPEYKELLKGFFGKQISLKRRDANGVVMLDNNGIEITFDTIEAYEPEHIIRYDIKEDWFFDKQRSMLDVRIIGICPVVYNENSITGAINGVKPLFWLYFPECRYIFQNFFVYNPENDAQRMSFDDLFWKRDFSSYIIKESNVFDRKVNPNWSGLDALLESERVREEMFTFEHDLWHF